MRAAVHRRFGGPGIVRQERVEDADRCTEECQEGT